MHATSQRDFYEILGVPRDAAEKKIKDAFRELALKYEVSSRPQQGAERAIRSKGT